MAPGIALCLALVTAQSSAPSTQQPSEPPAALSIPQTPAPPTPTEVRAAIANRPCSPEPSGLYKGKVGMTPPKLIYSVDPSFSKEARKKKISGNALVNLTVDPQGQPLNVHIAHSLASSVDKKRQAAALTLDQIALDAVKKYRFEPATCQGKAVSVELNVEITFTIF